MKIEIKFTVEPEQVVEIKHAEKHSGDKAVAILLVLILLEYAALLTWALWLILAR